MIKRGKPQKQVFLFLSINILYNFFNNFKNKLFIIITAMHNGIESKNPLIVRRYINIAGVNTWQKLFSTEPARIATPKERIKGMRRHFVFDTYHTKSARDGQPIKNSFVLGRIPINLSI